MNLQWNLRVLSKSLSLEPKPTVPISPFRSSFLFSFVISSCALFSLNSFFLYFLLQHTSFFSLFEPLQSSFVCIQVYSFLSLLHTSFLPSCLPLAAFAPEGTTAISGTVACGSVRTATCYNDPF